MLRFDIALKPLDQHPVCGDQAGYWQKSPGHYLACMIDGLGHGDKAYQAATCCLQTIEQYCHQPISQLMELCNANLTSTRGVALSLVEFDTNTNSLQYLGVGNIGACVLGEKSNRLVNSYGIIGQQQASSPYIQTQTFNPSTDALIMFSDGINEAANFIHYQSIIKAGISQVAETILEQEALGTDDAGVIVIY